MENNERLTLTLPELAGIIGISKGLCYELAGRNELPIKVIRCGRRMFVSRRAVEKLLSEGQIDI